MYSKVLVPLDGSKTAEKVLPLARCFARGLQIPVELLGVVDVAEMTRHVTADQVSMIRTLVEDATRRFENYLAGVAKNFPTGSVRCTVQQGNAAEAIVERAKQEPECLIAMGTHGRSSVKLWLLGSVAAKVVQAAENPLLLVRATDQAEAKSIVRFDSILVPLDGSELAESVLPGVLDLARSLNTEVVLARTFQLPPTTYYRADDTSGGAAFIPSYQELIAAVSQEAREYLDAKVREISAHTPVRIRAEILEGPAAEQIIDRARRTSGSLIAMCTHGRSGLRRWLLGSVTEKVVRHAESPILIIRAC